MVLKHVYGEGRGKLYVAYVDNATAFDSVNRQQFWKVLESSGLSAEYSRMLKLFIQGWSHVSDGIMSLRNSLTSPLV